MSETYRIAGDNGKRLHIVRETHGGVTRGQCGVILQRTEVQWDDPNRPQAACWRCVRSKFGIMPNTLDLAGGAQGEEGTR